MSDIPEAIGELAQGGLTARALEPAAGEGEGHTHERACLNCGTPLVGPHCHACGQRGHVHKTLGAFFHDLIHAVLHFEGKVWRTVPMLAWRPGRLTREYIDGRRASYVSPIALFLFTIFLMFAVFSALGTDTALVESIDVDTTAATEQAYRATSAKLEAAREDLAGEDDADDLAELEADIAQLERQAGFLGSAMGVAEAADTRTEGPQPTGIEIKGGRSHHLGRLRGGVAQGPREPAAADLQAADQRLQVRLAADPDQRPVRGADLRLAAPLRAL